MHLGFLIATLVILVVGMNVINSCKARDCATICEHKSMYEPGGYAADKCYCRIDNEWKLEKVY